MESFTNRMLIMFCLCLACRHAMAAADDQKPVVHGYLSAEKRVDRHTIDGELFTELIRGTTERYGEIPRPFFYPIIGPTGAEMTRSYPMKQGVKGEADDHPHHRSLWFAHGNVNGVDYWAQGEGKGTIRSDKTISNIDRSMRFPGDQIGSIRNRNIWIDPTGKSILINESRYNVKVLEDHSRVIDLTHAMFPADGVEQLLFGDTKEGMMAIRLAPQLRLTGKVATGKAVNSEGVTGKDIWGKRAKWVAYWGVIDGKTCGVAIFDHPTNLRHPTWWHARDYGLVAANPFGVSDFEKLKPRGKGEYTLKQDEQLKLRYRFVFFAGTAEEADIAGKYKQWVKETTKKAE